MPIADLLIDDWRGHEIMSFMDGHPQSEGSVGSNGTPSWREEVSRASSWNSNARRPLEEQKMSTLTRLLEREGRGSHTSRDAIQDVLF